MKQYSAGRFNLQESDPRARCQRKQDEFYYLKTYVPFRRENSDEEASYYFK